MQALLSLAVDSRAAVLELERFKQTCDAAAASTAKLEAKMQLGSTFSLKADPALQSLERILASADKTTGALRSIGRDPISLRTENAVQSVGRLNSSLDGTLGLIGKLGGATAAIFAGSKLVGSIGAFTQAASDARETRAQFEWLYDGITDKANESARKLETSFGQSSISSRAMLTSMGDLFVGMGMTSSEALKLSSNIGQLSVDIGSYKNVRPEQAVNAFTSAIMGNSMALKSLGIDVSDYAKKEEMARQKREGLVFENERLAQSYAILSLATKQSEKAIGDYSKEVGSYSNQTRLLKQNFGEAAAKIGEAFLPVMTKLTRTLNVGLTAFNSLDQGTINFISRTAALAGGFATVQFATKTLSPIISSLAAATGLSSKAIDAETLSLSANTKAWTVNTVARQGAGVASSFGGMGGGGTKGGRGSSGGSGNMLSVAGNTVTYARLTKSLVDTALHSEGLTRATQRLSLGFKSLTPVAGNVDGTVARISPSLAKAAGLLGPIGVTVATVVTVGKALDGGAMKLETAIRKVPVFAESVNRAFDKFVLETVPNAFQSIGSGIYQWGGKMGFEVQQMLARPFYTTDTMNLYDSNEQVDKMLNRKTGRVNADGKEETVREMMDRNNAEFRPLKERQAEKLKADEKAFEPIKQVFPELRDGLRSTMKDQDDDYAIGLKNAADQATAFSKKLDDVESKLKRYDSGDRKFLASIGKDEKELAKWRDDMLSSRNEFRQKRDASILQASRDQEEEYDSWYRRLSDDGKYQELQRRLAGATRSYNSMQTESGRQYVQPRIDDLKTELKPLEERMRQRDDYVFESGLKTMSLSKQRDAVKNRLDSVLGEALKFTETENLSGVDADVAFSRFQEAAKLNEQYAALVSRGNPSLSSPLVTTTSAAAVTRESVDAGQYESRVWDTQQAIEKDTHVTAETNKKIADSLKTLVGLAQKKAPAPVQVVTLGPGR